MSAHTENTEAHGDHEDVVLPRSLRGISTAIDESRWLLELEDNWDDEGSPGYAEATWERAVAFLRQNALHLWTQYHIRVDAPRILPGPDGSIDIHWRTNTHELLINIPADPGQLATYYGDDKTGDVVKGSLNVSAKNQWLLLWLTE